MMVSSSRDVPAAADPAAQPATDPVADSKAPALSVVIVRFAGGPLVERALDALSPQRGAHVEVVVAHQSLEGPTREQQARYPWVRWVDGGAPAPPARLRAAGVRRCRGAVIACTEDHCIPATDWCERILASHATRAAVIGGAIDKAEPAGALPWAAYLLDYGRYMPPLAAGPAAYASDCNVSYRRADLARVAEAWREEFHETTVHWALAAAGVPTVLDPAIVVRQDRTVQLSAWLAERREHGRIFARTRVAGAPASRRIRWTLSALLLPAVLIWRVRVGVRARHAAARVPRGAWRPLVLAAVAWSRGELEGYLGAPR